jgi:hypothetical protein
MCINENGQNKYSKRHRQAPARCVLYVRRVIHEMNVASENMEPSSENSSSPTLSFRVSFSWGEYWPIVSLTTHIPIV